MRAKEAPPPLRAEVGQITTKFGHERDGEFDMKVIYLDIRAFLGNFGGMDYILSMQLPIRS